MVIEIALIDEAMAYTSVLSRRHDVVLCPAEFTQPDDIIVLCTDFSTIPEIKRCSGPVFAAAHKLPPYIIPEGVSSPFVVVVRSTNTPIRFLEAVIRSYKVYFSRTIRILETLQSRGCSSDDELVEGMRIWHQENGYLTPLSWVRNVTHPGLRDWIDNAEKILINRFLEIQQTGDPEPLRTSPAW